MKEALQHSLVAVVVRLASSFMISAKPLVTIATSLQLQSPELKV